MSLLLRPISEHPPSAPQLVHLVWAQSRTSTALLYNVLVYIPCLVPGVYHFSVPITCSWVWKPCVHAHPMRHVTMHVFKQLAQKKWKQKGDGLGRSHVMYPPAPLPAGM